MRYLVPSLARCADGRRPDDPPQHWRGRIIRRQGVLGLGAIIDTETEHLLILGQVAATRAGPLANRRYRR